MGIQTHDPLCYGVDMSNWGGPLTTDQVQGIVAAGYNRFIVATGPGSYGEQTIQQIEAIKDVPGTAIEAYTYLEWRSASRWSGIDEKAWIRAALQSAGEYADDGTICRWWLDVEDNSKNGYGMTVSQRVGVVESAFAEFDVWTERLHCDPAGLYTGAWYWVSDMGNTARFADRLLWESYYDSDPDIDGWSMCPWDVSKIAISQYEGSTVVAGYSVDLNAIYILDQGGEMSALEEINKLKVMLLAGSEEGDISFDQKLALANQRLANAGNEQSVRDVAYSAMAVAKDSHGGAGELTPEEIARVARSLTVVPAIAAG